MPNIKIEFKNYDQHNEGFVMCCRKKFLIRNLLGIIYPRNMYI